MSSRKSALVKQADMTQKTPEPTEKKQVPRKNPLLEFFDLAPYGELNELTTYEDYLAHKKRQEGFLNNSLAGKAITGFGNAIENVTEGAKGAIKKGLEIAGDEVEDFVYRTVTPLWEQVPYEQRKPKK